jgi:glycosyltransferase involved in cell wall biosynthesis
VKIVFYANRMFLEGDYLSRRGLGGSESALINVTTTWKQSYPDDEIIVINGLERSPNKREYNGIKYLPRYEFKNQSGDVFVSLRDVDQFFSKQLSSQFKLKVLWSQDDMNEVGLQTLKNSIYATENVDLMFVISEHSKNSIGLSFPNNELLIIRNGYNSDLASAEKSRRLPIAIYSSTPFRGLDVLAEVWSDIFHQSVEQCIIKYGVPPQLNIFTGMQLYDQDNAQYGGLYNYLYEQPNVKLFGPFPQYSLYEELQKTTVMLYPNHFLETGCMSVTEALSCGVWVITSNLGALSEQVKHQVNGNLIDGDSRSIEYKEKFISYAVESLTFCHTYQPNSDGLIFSWKDQVDKMRKYVKERL